MFALTGSPGSITLYLLEAPRFPSRPWSVQSRQSKLLNRGYEVSDIDHLRGLLPVWKDMSDENVNNLSFYVSPVLLGIPTP